MSTSKLSLCVCVCGGGGGGGKGGMCGGEYGVEGCGCGCEGIG